MHFYPHNIGDFNNATRHLTRVERSVYRDALELYYDRETKLPRDIELLQRKLLCHTDEEKKALSVVLSEFFSADDDGYYHERCALEIEKYSRNTSAKAKAGIASAAKRKQKSTRDEQNATGVRKQETITNKQETHTIDDVIAEHFPILWAAYPARPGKSKANALKQYRARIREGVSPGQLLAGVTAYAAHCQRTGMEAQFIKQPETFLGKGEHYLANWEPVALTAAQTGQTLHERMNDRGWADPEKTNNNEHAIEGTATHVPEEADDNPP